MVPATKYIVIIIKNDMIPLPFNSLRLNAYAAHTVRNIPITVNVTVTTIVTHMDLIARKKDLVFDICIICIPLAIVGARLYYVIFDVIGNPDHTHWGFKEILGIGSGGLSGLAIYDITVGKLLSIIRRTRAKNLFG